MEDEKMKGTFVVLVALTLVSLAFFSAVPATAGISPQDEVAKLVDDYTAARSAGEVDRMLAHIAEDANMVSFAGKDQTKAQFGEAVRRNLQKEAASTHRIELVYKILKIDVQDPTHVKVLIGQNSFAVEKDGFGGRKWVEENRFEWKLELREGKWLVVHQKWTKTS
jgi:ketosteroid isomerase-like protein